ncbi:MAG TPA: MFS transporter [Ktedonobacteraceae bacterium]|jgi:MFS family permease|nr:MFS transporter [Ktedonobacteraceae bacterium]
MRASIRPEWITRDMELLLAARMLMSAARAFAGIVVPIYLALIGYSGFLLGLLFTVVALTSAVLAGCVGLLADRFGRKAFLIIIPWFAAVAAIVFAFSQAMALIFIFAALGSFGRGAGAGSGTIGPYQPAEQALLADAVAAQHRNKLFGRIAFASSLGSLIGTGVLAELPVILSWFGLPVLQGLIKYRLMFLLMAGIALGAGLLALPVSEPKHTALSSVQHQPVGKQRRGIQLSRQSWFVLLRLWVTNSVNGLAVGFFGPFITYWFYRRYGAGTETVGLLYTVINLVAMFGNLGAARFAERLGLVRAITISRTLQAVLILPMILMPNFWLAGGVYLLRMLAQRIGLPLRQSYVLGVVRSEERGTVGALSNLPSQVTSAASPSLAGYLFDHVSLSLPFEIGAILQGTNTLIFYLFFHDLQPPEEKSEERQARSPSG